MSTTKSPSIGPLRPNGAAAPVVRGRRPSPACPRKAAKSVGARPRDPASVKRRPDAAVSAKRSASAPNRPPSALHVPQPAAGRAHLNTLATPKRRHAANSAFGRSDTTRPLPCVELWGPLSSKQRAAAESTPLHMRPGLANKTRRRGQVRGSSNPRHSEPVTPHSSRSARASESQNSSTYTEPLGHVIDGLYVQLEDLLLECESRARNAIEMGAASTLKTCLASSKLAVRLVQKALARTLSTYPSDASPLTPSQASSNEYSRPAELLDNYS
ncbi:hypothetical protein DIPPA_29598 [Diplonema papillatum]|nr:hypothetical protein DIPPA_29598 [Diplonema papillatum]